MKISLSKRKRAIRSNMCLVLILALFLTFVLLGGIFIHEKDQQQVKKESKSLPNPMSISDPNSGTTETLEEEGKFKEVERAAQAARAVAQKLASENPPRFWQAERVIFHTDSVWVVLKEENQNLPPGQGSAPTVGLVIHKSHEYYSDCLEFAGTVAARDDKQLTTRLFYVGLADNAHPDSPAAYPVSTF